MSIILISTLGGGDQEADQAGERLLQEAERTAGELQAGH